MNRTAKRLVWLVTTPILGLQIGAGMVGYALGSWNLATTGFHHEISLSSVTEVIGTISLLLLTTLWHELGHAAALRYEEYPPGVIGMGLLVCLPVLYCDVTAAMALPRRGRLRVDVAGLAFQLAAGGLLFLIGIHLRIHSLGLAGFTTLVAVIWSLLPFLRTDGYWLLCDLLGRRDLDSPLAAEEGSRVKISIAEGTGPGRDGWERIRVDHRRRLLALTLIAYRLIHGLFLLAVAGWLSWRLWRWLPLTIWLKDEATSCRWAAAALLVVFVVLLLLLGNTIGRRLQALAVASWQDGRVVMGRGATGG